MSDASSASQAEASAVLPDSLLLRFDTPGPPYTTYPTSDRFVEAFGPSDVVRALAQRVLGGALGGLTPLSVYVHIPFCESVCHYCACNKVITKHHQRSAEYLDVLDTEIGLVRDALGAGQRVAQLHFGGGSPTFLRDAELERVVASLRRAFLIAADVEMSIEVDPRSVTPARLATLRAIGFSRMRFGVQDFDLQVQKAVHRVQTFESVRELIGGARGVGCESIGADLIYGLPRQTPDSFARTVTQVAGLRPDLIAVNAYAHQPDLFKPQRRIVDAELPTASDRLRMLGGAIASLLVCGYQHIGMGHFALPGDALAVAKRQGRLHRSFQGYSTQPERDLIALGVSAIGRIGASYYQNAINLPAYYDALRRGRLPVVRGLALNRDDLLRRTIIMALICQGRVEFESMENAYMINMRDYFSDEWRRLAPLAQAGLVEIEADAIEVTAAGGYVVRSIAMVFDRYLQTDLLRRRYSRII